MSNSVKNIIASESPKMNAIARPPSRKQQCGLWIKRESGGKDDWRADHHDERTFERR